MAYPDELTAETGSGNRAGHGSDPQHPALLAYRARTRRSMSIYAGALVLILLLTFVVIKVIYAHGELTKVSRLTAPAPATIAITPTAERLSLRWRSTDRPAGGNPYSSGIVVTYAGHTVNGRDALTGAVRWHYTRSDEDVCDVVQQDQSTIAFYNRDGNCDEVTAFVTATGEPKWYRTLTDDGRLSVSSAPNVVLVVSDTTVHVFDNAGGIDRWAWAAPNGCIVDRALGGTNGVLASYHCGTTNHLMVHDLTTGAEVPRWTITVATPFVPVAAGTLLAAASATTGRVQIFSADKGVAGAFVSVGDPSTVRAQLPALSRSQTTTESFDAKGRVFELVRLEAVFCLNSVGRTLWSAPSDQAPTVIDGDQVATARGATLVLHTLTTGRPTKTVTLTGRSTVGARVFEVSSGLVIAGTTTEMYS
ncbi:hypothetical protein BH10ACT8_BH10ACT8_06980 [soil metagenome]